jgi:hypothetical protein
MFVAWCAPCVAHTLVACNVSELCWVYTLVTASPPDSTFKRTRWYLYADQNSISLINFISFDLFVLMPLQSWLLKESQQHPYIKRYSKRIGRHSIGSQASKSKRSIASTNVWIVSYNWLLNGITIIRHCTFWVHMCRRFWIWSLPPSESVSIHSKKRFI